MADRGDTHYRVPSLNKWFALSSVVFALACFWMMLDDWSREWKQYQREWRRIETDRARAALATPEALAALAREESLLAQLFEAEAQLERRRAEIEPEEEELWQLDGEQFKATEAAKSAKQDFNHERFLFEEGHSTVEKVKEREDTFNATAKTKEEVDLAYEVQKKVIDDLRSGIADIEGPIKEAVKDIDLVRKKLDGLAPEDFPGKLANIIRDFPGVDFIGPNLKVKKVVLENLDIDVKFTMKARIDMCMTCHLAIDQEGYEDGLEQPFVSHPNLDLYMTAQSPHPMSLFGCTICHRGSGESLHFVRTDHRPSDEAEATEWEEEHHWHKQHHWDTPMLSSEYVEASCVQCHKTSMELIADEAPRVSEGYRLFERYGCYTCHKVDWFPTKRRPGPSLKGLRRKVAKDFVPSWVADPRGFRPTTWMPQLFHLENFAPDEEIIVSRYGAEGGRPILGQEWNDTAVAAISAFVWDSAYDERADPIPVEGDPLRGKEVFRLSGCLACHNMTPHEKSEPEDASDLALQAHGTNEHGPNLRGIATKVTPEWLFAWIGDPSAYWSETRMPDLRLEDQDIADVVAYVFDDPDGWFHDVPAGWNVAAATYDREVLEEQARWYYSLKGRGEVERLFDADWADDTALLVAVGQKLVTNHGCHSCHEIAGLEDEMPIGTELTNWGSKTVDKLDWAFIPEILGEELGWDHHRIEQFKEYREGWIEQKLHEPRSYDRGKAKFPTEKLKMPWFDLEEDEVQAISTFVVGLVLDEVPRAKMIPSAGEVQMDTGLRVMRQKNCAACHLIEPGTVTYTDGEGERRTIVGQILALGEDEILPPPMGSGDHGFHPFVAEFEEFMEEELEEVIVQLLRPEPALGEDVGGKIFIEDDIDGIETTAPWGGDFVPLVVRYYRVPTDEDDLSLTGDPEGEGRVQDVDGEWRSYESEPFDTIRWTFAPPYLKDEGYKVQREWFYRFLLDPEPLRQQLRVKMPTFNWEDGEAGAVADYFAQAAARDWPSRFARRLLLDLRKSPGEVAAEMIELGITGSSAKQIQGIADGSRPAIEAGLKRLSTYADRKGYSPGSGFGHFIAPPVDPGHEAIPQRQPTVLGPVLAADPTFFDRVRVLTSNNTLGPNCFQCHFLGGDPPKAEGPIAWAPDLMISRERLRPDWTREWMVDPGKIYLGTAMPANFPLDQTSWQVAFPGTSAEQIEAILLWLFNLDRASNRN
ncbi:MAG: c-type cytochrome [Planctomycetota bacterium]|nr:c-type cytochrome [Planctomycetota bacterium]